MYLVGKVKRVIDAETVAWEAVRLCLTLRGAENRCPTANFFYLKIGFKALPADAEPIFPKLVKE